MLYFQKGEMMFLDYYYEYEKQAEIVSVPDFKAFLIRQYPTAYKDIVLKFSRLDPQWKDILILIEAKLVTRELLNEVNSKPVERLFKKYHNYQDEDKEVSGGNITVNIVEDKREDD